LIATPVAVVVVEDDPFVRDELVAAIEHDGRFAVTASVGTVREAQEALARSAPTVVLLDLGLPDGDGSELIPAAREAGADVLVLTVRSDAATTAHALALGAAGYLVKDESIAGVARAIDSLCAGHVVLSPAVAQRLVERMRALAPSDPAQLTSQERSVLEALRGGGTYAEVAAGLGITINTVRTHVRNLYAKLGVNSRFEALSRVARR
jgi:DNA-binding NarL/FixJ family response regulator